MADTVFPHRLQDSSIPSPDEIRARQAGHIKWRITSDSAGEEVNAVPTRRPESALTASQIESLLEDEYRRKGMIDIPEGFRVTFMAKGQFAFVFKLHCTDKDESWTDKRLPGVTIPPVVLLRANLPWAPYYGTESEVATMAYLGSRGVPAPRVYFFDSSARNSLGIEFTIQEYIQKSATLTSVLNVINSHSVSKLYILEAVKLQQTIWNAGGDFDQSGSLYCDWDSETKPDYFVGPMVDPEFFAPLLEGSRFQYGPFGSWGDVVGAFISTREGRDWDACEDADGIRSRLPPCEVTGEQLRAKIREIDAMPDATPDLTFKPRLVHWDMHGENILVRVTDDGADIEIAALIDWDAVVIEPAGICRSIMPACALEFQRDWDLARREFNLPAEWFSEKASAAKEYLTAHIPFFYLDKQVRIKKK